jgi:hypothetical protein
VVLFSGCIRKTLEITSEPPGAQVIVNGEAAGDTPVKMQFQHHGVYRVELRKPGYVPVVDGLRVRARLYEFIGIDIISGLVWPGTIRDERKAHYRLKKIPPMDAEKLLAAARKAAAEAEKAIPRLIQLPETDRKTLDAPLLKAMSRNTEEKKKPSPPKNKRPEHRQPAVVPEKKPDDEDHSLDIPEIEENRNR